eukprot:COSAG02_NODE_7848_length_2820_cov_3.458287_1_plen_97_part_00
MWRVTLRRCEKVAAAYLATEDEGYLEEGYLDIGRQPRPFFCILERLESAPPHCPAGLIPATSVATILNLTAMTKNIVSRDQDAIRPLEEISNCGSY